MTFNIPQSLSPLNAINISKEIGSCEEDTEYVYDFSKMQHCPPFGLLVVSSAVRCNKKRFCNASHKCIGTLDTQGGQFAATFGLYQSMGFDIGFAKEENENGSRYIPIKEITAKELHEIYKGTTVLNEKIERHAEMLSNTLVGDLPRTVRETLQYCIREILRNTFEHAKVESVWLCGQYWPSRGEAEIAILDEGIGILKSLQRNRLIKVRDCYTANRLALQPGLSCTIGKQEDPNDVWQNSGYGLYVASAICALNKGFFFISSGSSAIRTSEDPDNNYEACQAGTAICLNIKTDGRKYASFDSVLEEIVARGQSEAALHKDIRILTASQMTTVASFVRDIKKLTTADDKKVEKNRSEIVTFCCERIDKEGNIVGHFNRGENTCEGRLVGLKKTNKKIYVENQRKIAAQIYKQKEESYYLRAIAFESSSNKLSQ